MSHIYFESQFNKGSQTTKLKILLSSASVLLHEWGHLRWGLKDEYPTVRKGSGITWKFQPANGEWKPVGYALG